MMLVQECEVLSLPRGVRPAEIYALLSREFGGGESYLLESREGVPRVARFSILGFDPALKFSVKDRRIQMKFYDDALRKSFKRKESGGSPLSVLREFLAELNAVVVASPRVRRLARSSLFQDDAPPLAERFVGGFVGYISYDFVRYFVDLDEKSEDDLKQPDCEFLLAKKNIVLDHKEQKAFIFLNEFCSEENAEANSSLFHTTQILGEVFSDVLNGNGSGRGGGRSESGMREDEISSEKGKIGRMQASFTANMSREEFERIVRRAKEYIHAGDILQVVLSQRIEADFYGEPFEFYMRLSELNPSPYMYFLNFKDRKIAGASPEMLVKVDASRKWFSNASADAAVAGKRLVRSCPIAGTRRRGRNEEEDKMLESEMLSDEKERAEHLMLVDLARNDIGKVSKFGTVSVPRFMYVEKYSHVQHIVSDVEGEMREDKDEFDALEATFPAGTVSGAPKVRAMEIIEELEPTRRGIYAGCVGYFSFNRSADTAITIRTAVFERRERRKIFIQAGAGIVADSVPEREYKETMNKCAALLACLF